MTVEIIKNAVLSDAQKETFKRDGAIVLKDFFYPEFLHQIQQTIAESTNRPTDKYQSGFNRVGYDSLDNSTVIQQIISNKTFRKSIAALIESNVIFTQGIAFELEAETNKGFPWHIGTQSFGFQSAQDFGFTIWIPFMDIDPQQQAGGMKYIPTSAISGEFMYTHIDPATFHWLSQLELKKQSCTLEEYLLMRDGPLNNPGILSVAEKYVVTPTLKLGDAIIFNKFVIHASNPLRHGASKKRLALALRFVDSKSTFDETRAQNLEIPRRMLNFSGPSKFHLSLELSDGQVITESPRFTSEIGWRLIHSE